MVASAVAGSPGDCAEAPRGSPDVAAAAAPCGAGTAAGPAGRGESPPIISMHTTDFNPASATSMDCGMFPDRFYSNFDDVTSIPFANHLMPSDVLSPHHGYIELMTDKPESRGVSLQFGLAIARMCVVFYNDSVDDSGAGAVGTGGGGGFGLKGLEKNSLVHKRLSFALSKSIYTYYEGLYVNAPQMSPQSFSPFFCACCGPGYHTLCT